MKLHNRSPLIVPWWVLTGIYIAFVALGLAAVIFGSPTLDLTTPNGYAAVWGAVVALAATGATIGSLSPKREPLERWSTVALVSVLVVFTFSAVVLLVQGGTDSWSRATFTILAVMITALPAVRVAFLLRRAGVKTE